MSLETDVSRPAFGGSATTMDQIDVLRALLRLARRRTQPTLEQIVVRVGGEEPEVRDALRALARRGLVQRSEAGLRLSLQGFAVAVAVSQLATAKSKVAKTTKPAHRRAA